MTLYIDYDVTATHVIVMAYAIKSWTHANITNEEMAEILRNVRAALESRGTKVELTTCHIERMRMAPSETSLRRPIGCKLSLRVVRSIRVVCCGKSGMSV